ncbi:MAG: RNA polymerase sigma factor [Bacteroidales bacterium]|nr:RNA polymerase sigma factor [Bacteroidales bacterium]
MASSESHGANPSNIDTAQSDFNALVLRHKAMLWHICSDYNIGKAWKTEDCLQEVLISLWRSYGSFEKRSSEKTWVWRVATNTMLMLRRKDVRSPQTDSIDTVHLDEKNDETTSRPFGNTESMTGNNRPRRPFPTTTPCCALPNAHSSRHPCNRQCPSPSNGPEIAGSRTPPRPASSSA